MDIISVASIGAIGLLLCLVIADISAWALSFVSQEMRHRLNSYYVISGLVGFLIGIVAASFVGITDPIWQMIVIPAIVTAILSISAYMYRSV